MDPTVNVLMSWSGLTFAIVAVLATMGLVSTERDRGTLGWNLTNPVSPSSILAAKWTAAVLVYGLVGVVAPLVVSTIVATVAYGSVPDLGTVGLFALLYLTVPAFYIGLMIALGSWHEVRPPASPASASSSCSCRRASGRCCRS